MTDRPADEKFDFVRSIPHWGVPLTALVGVLLVPFHGWYVLVAVGLYVVRMFALTAGYHRYFAHRTFKTSRPFQLLLAIAGATCAQRGPIWWTAHHRNHHRYTDLPKDVHSPAERGLWWAHVGWLLCRKTDSVDVSRVRDLNEVPELRWMEKYWLLFPVALALALLLTGGVGLLVWGFFVSTTLLWHGTYTINSIAHRWGRIRYATGDSSRNNWVLALITLGEGWHNNHHRYMSSARQGFFWWEVDITYYGLWLLQRIGLIWELREVPRRVRSSQLVQRGTAPDHNQSKRLSLSVVSASTGDGSSQGGREGQSACSSGTQYSLPPTDSTVPSHGHVPVLGHRHAPWSCSVPASSSCSSHTLVMASGETHVVPS